MGIEASAGNLLQGFGAGFSAVGAYSQAKSQQSALTAQAQVEANNATLNQWQAEDATARGELAVGQAQLQYAQTKGATRAALAANGVDLSVGSPASVVNDVDYAASVDVAQIRNNAAREAWGYSMQAKQATQRSAAASAGASQVSPWLQAGTSLLTSATRASSRWYQTNKATT